MLALATGTGTGTGSLRLDRVGAQVARLRVDLHTCSRADILRAAGPVGPRYELDMSSSGSIPCLAGHTNLHPVPPSLGRPPYDTQTALYTGRWNIYARVYRDGLIDRPPHNPSSPPASLSRPGVSAHTDTTRKGWEGTSARDVLFHTRGRLVSGLRRQDLLQVYYTTCASQATSSCRTIRARDWVARQIRIWG